MSINFYCPKCYSSFSVHEENTDDLYEHINECFRKLNCTRCEVETYTTEADLINHYLTEHSSENVASGVSCPLCGKSDLNDGASFLNHLEIIHSVVMPSKEGNVLDDELKEKLPKIGDRIIAMWGQSKWQYFTACIKR